MRTSFFCYVSRHRGCRDPVCPRACAAAAPPALPATSFERMVNEPPIQPVGLSKPRGLAGSEVHLGDGIGADRPTAVAGEDLHVVTGQDAR